MDRDLLALISTLSSLHVYVARQGPALDAAPMIYLAPAAERLAAADDDADALKQVFDSAHAEIRAHRDALGAETPLADRIVATRTLEIADRMRAIAARHRTLVTERASPGRQKPPPSTGTRWPVNWPRVIRNSLASLAAVSMGGVVWLYFHEQMATIIIVALGGAVATLFSATPAPVTAAAQFAKGTVIATVASFVINFVGFPQANGFVTYVLLTAPVLFVAGLAMTHGPIALPARIFVVVFELTLHTENAVRIDLATFAQFALGIYGAVGVAMLAFALILERDPAHQLRHQLRDIFQELAAGLAGPRARFEARIYDRLDGLALLDDQGRHPYDLNRAVLAGINLVLEARRLAVLTRRLKREAALGRRAEALIGQIRTGLAERWRHVSFDDLRAELARLGDDFGAASRAPGQRSDRPTLYRAEITTRLMASALADYEALVARQGTADALPVRLAASGPNSA